MLEARAENKSGPPDGGVVASAAFEMVGARPNSLGFASTGREIGGAGPSGFVACPTHARTTWEGLGPSACLHRLYDYVREYREDDAVRLFRGPSASRFAAAALSPASFQCGTYDCAPRDPQASSAARTLALCEVAGIRIAIGAL